jgi:hypothetical protein
MEKNNFPNIGWGKEKILCGEKVMYDTTGTWDKQILSIRLILVSRSVQAKRSRNRRAGSWLSWSG